MGCDWVGLAQKQTDVFKRNGGVRELDPREVLLGIDLDEFSSRRLKREKRPSARDEWEGESDLLEQVKRLRRTVELDHDQRLKGIEINIRWLMVLVAGEVLAIVGYAVSSIAGG